MKLSYASLHHLRVEKIPCRDVSVALQVKSSVSTPTFGSHVAPLLDPREEAPLLYLAVSFRGSMLPIQSTLFSPMSTRDWNRFPRDDAGTAFVDHGGHSWDGNIKTETTDARKRWRRRLNPRYSLKKRGCRRSDLGMHGSVEQAKEQRDRQLDGSNYHLTESR